MVTLRSAGCWSVDDIVAGAGIDDLDPGQARAGLQCTAAVVQQDGVVAASATSLSVPAPP
jgi:hypothetical protein